MTGTVRDLGDIPFSVNPTTGLIKGAVTDAVNAAPIEGVAITVTGSFSGSVTTGRDGGFVIPDVTPGELTLTASKDGYYQVTGTGTVAAGDVLFFNPQLSTQPPQAATGDLTGIGP